MKSEDEQKANAEFIVAAVNSHNALKGALRSWIAHEKMVCRSEHIGGVIGSLIAQSEAALALAERGAL